MALQIQQLGVQKSYSDLELRNLFFSLAEDLKLPLIQIARIAELSKNKKDAKLVEQIEAIADNSLQLIDGFILNSYLQNLGDAESMQPVSITASFQDSAHLLSSYAKKNNCNIEIEITGKLEPILANPNALKSAMISLGKVFINYEKERQNNSSNSPKCIIKLASHRTRSGIAAGIFTESKSINSKILRQAKNIHGKAINPMNQLVSNNGVGVFIADLLLKQMSSGLKVAYHHKQTGLAATFSPSHQLELV